MSPNFSYLLENPAPFTDLQLAEFQKSVLLWILMAGGLPILLWQMLEKNPLILLICMVTMLTVALLIWNNRYLAGIALFFGFSALFLGLAVIEQMPAIALILCLFPLVMSICFGFVGGGLAFLGLILEVWLLATYSSRFQLGEITWSITLGGGILLFMGLLVRYWMMVLVSQYFDYYQRALNDLIDAREQRVELKQVQADLMHANSELVRLTRQMKVLNQVAEEARVAKETFVAMVSHELRTPLNMIIGFSEVITQTPGIYGNKLPATLLADIRSIQRNSQHLLELVNDVLDLSQVDMGNLAISREWCTIHEIVSEAFEVIQPLFNSKELYLKADLPEPGSKADQNIYCDKTRVREIIINLLSNAGRFTEQGGVSVRAHFESNHLIVMVEDTGPGISDENQTRLFEPFQQLDSSIRRRYGGSGLGLAICKRFVEMHGGKMWLESEVGEGTTFLFSLPVSSMEMDNYGTNATRWVNDYTVRDVRTRSFKVSLGIPKPRCIVLEDGETIHHLLNRYLDHIEILPVQTVGEVIEKVAQFPSQLVIINHPDSVSLLNSITSQGHLPVGLPVLAFWMPGAEDFSDTIGANRYFVKPVSKDILLEAVTSFGDQVKRILIVDDNPEIIQLFGRILASADRHYQVLRASDGPQALELMRSRQPDLMILDLIMPEINGFQVLEEKRGDPAICDIPVIVITAQDPAGLPKVSYSVTIAREGGFSSRDILDLVESVGLKSDVVQPNAGTG